MNIRLQEGAVMPKRGSKLAAGYDLCAYKSVVIPAGTQKKIPTGVHIQMPSSIDGTISHRSGMNSKQGVLIYGVIDPDYIGELKVTMFNCHPSKSVIVEVGDRIAQVVFREHWIPSLTVVSLLKGTERGAGGHGSTGR
jgi:dUTP pyrophosphatase